MHRSTTTSSDAAGGAGRSARLRVDWVLRENDRVRVPFRFDRPRVRSAMQRVDSSAHRGPDARACATRTALRLGRIPGSCLRIPSDVPDAARTRGTGKAPGGSDTFRDVPVGLHKAPDMATSTTCTDGWPTWLRGASFLRENDKVRVPVRVDRPRLESERIRVDPSPLPRPNMEPSASKTASCRRGHGQTRDTRRCPVSRKNLTPPAPISPARVAFPHQKGWPTRRRPRGAR